VLKQYILKSDEEGSGKEKTPTPWFDEKVKKLIISRIDLRKKKKKKRSESGKSKIIGTTERDENQRILRIKKDVLNVLLFIKILQKWPFKLLLQRLQMMFFFHD
jgi:hypothetical protein